MSDPRFRCIYIFFTTTDWRGTSLNKRVMSFLHSIPPLLCYFILLWLHPSFTSQRQSLNPFIPALVLLVPPRDSRQAPREGEKQRRYTLIADTIPAFMMPLMRPYAVVVMVVVVMHESYGSHSSQHLYRATSYYSSLLRCA